MSSLSKIGDTLGTVDNKMTLTLQSCFYFALFFVHEEFDQYCMFSENNCKGEILIAKIFFKRGNTDVSLIGALL